MCQTMATTADTVCALVVEQDRLFPEAHPAFLPFRRSHRTIFLFPPKTGFFRLSLNLSATEPAPSSSLPADTES